MQNSHIEWTDHTFNPWEGCTKVSPGCTNCYAEARNQRFSGGENWGKGAPRRRTSIQNWKQPLKWDREARGEGRESLECPSCEAPWKECDCGFAQRRPRVFCASLADWLDDEVPIEWLADLLKLIHDTPNLDWQLLTKRPQNWRRRVEQVSERFRIAGDAIRMPWATSWLEGDSPENVWLGTSVENQEMADKRIPLLLSIPAQVRFLSCEPLLGAVMLWSFDQECQAWRGPGVKSSGGMTISTPNDLPEGYDDSHPCIDWVICGGESGPGARPMHPDWARGLRDQCQVAGVPFLFKQWGEWWPEAWSGFTQWPEIDRKRPLLMPAHPGREGTDQHQVMQCRGKSKTGRVLDGRTWDDFPKVEVTT
jgi:protein gp37